MAEKKEVRANSHTEQDSNSAIQKKLARMRGRGRRIIFRPLSQRKGATLYSIARAAKEANVPRSSLYWAVEKGIVPHIPIEGMKGTEKVVHIDDVLKWRDSRSIEPSDPVRKKSAK